MTARKGDNSAGARRRKALLAAARDLFLEHGFDGVSVDQIVARAGGSKTSVYAYFKNKEGLFSALVEGVLEEFLDFPAPELGQAAAPREVLGAIGRGACRAVLRQDVMALYRLAVAESFRFPHVGAAFYAAGPRPARAALADYLAAATARGELAVPDPELASDFFLGMLLDRGTLEMSLVGGDPPGEDAILRRVDEAVALMLARYGKSGL